MAYSPMDSLVAPLATHEDLNDASFSLSPRPERSIGYSSGLCDSHFREMRANMDAATVIQDRWDLPPCVHNNFDNARVKKGMVELKCRDCGKKWRVQHPVATLCPEFHVTRGLCCLGSSCPYLHVHRYKSQERSPTHPHYVGGDRDDALRRAAVAVLETKPFGTLPANVIGEIRAIVAAGALETRKDAPVDVPVSRASLSTSIETESTYSSPESASREHRAVSPSDSQGSSLLPTPTTPGSRLLPITSCYEPIQRTMLSVKHQEERGAD